MDPNATLKELLQMAALLDGRTNYIESDDVQEMVDLVKSLDDWIKNGGLLPDAWAHARAAKPE